MSETSLHVPSAAAPRPRLGRTLVKLACAALLVGGAAQARHAACDAAPNGAWTGCAARIAPHQVPEPAARSSVIGTVSGAGSAATGGTLVLWQPDQRTDQPAVATLSAEAEVVPAAGSGEPPMLGLLLAVLGVVAFVAHRRSGR